jgi:peptidoglycan hydrolase-like protein with peptidoglycan-binding domain
MRRLAVLFSLLFASPAAAQVPAPVVKLKLEPHALAGEAWRVTGSVTPADVVQLRISRDGKLLQKRTARPDAAGRFALKLRGRKAGSYRVVAVHYPTATLAYARTRRKRVLVHRPAAFPGAPRFVIRKLQHRLAAVGYVVGARGRFDARTARAVLAFRKTTGMARTTAAGPSVFRRLARGGGRFRVRYRSHGRHVEASLSKQVMALIGRGGRVERIYPISSGAPVSPTVTGNFKVYRRDPGTNVIGMIHTSYFWGAYAIHGYRSVPIYPASHGCLRVPPDDAWSVFRWVRYGTRVDVYR